MKKTSKLVIAVDGPAASGKGTIAKRLAEILNMAHLDTGSLYRAVAYLLDQRDITAANLMQHFDVLKAIEEKEILEMSVSPKIRTEGMGELASNFSKFIEVRTFLLHLQRNFAYCPPKSCDGSILDGRDIGTVICPDADYKFFITASLEIRAQRRFKELKEAGKNATFEAILQKMAERDEADKHRENSPLLPAQDAILLDNSSLSVDDCVAFCVDKIKKG